MRSSPIKPTLESLPTLRAAQFNDAGRLEPGARNDYVSDGLVAAIVAARDWLLITALTTTGALASVRIAIHRRSTPSGGARTLFGCPGCARGVAALYWYSDVIRCRYCVGLPYRSQQQSGQARRRQRVAALLECSTAENTPALFARPPRAHAAAWRRVLHDFGQVRAEEATRG